MQERSSTAIPNSAPRKSPKLNKAFAPRAKEEHSPSTIGMSGASPYGKNLQEAVMASEAILEQLHSQDMPEGLKD